MSTLRYENDLSLVTTQICAICHCFDDQTQNSE